MEIKSHGQGKDVWMNADELDKVLDYYEIGSDRWIAMSLHGRCGLKTKEVLQVEASDLIEDHDPILLEVNTSGQLDRRRRVPIPTDLAATINTRGEFQYSNDTKSNREGKQLNPIIDVSDRTIRVWAKAYVDELVDFYDNEDWKHLSPRSFRHSWATILLEDGVPPQTVMRWGGWNDSKNFHRLYISDYKESDFTQIYDSELFNSKPPQYLDE